MSALIIGYGSIGKKHAEILSRLGSTVSVVTSQAIENYLCYKTIEDAFKKTNVDYDYIIIANPTYMHYQTLKTMGDLGFQGIILVEKPLFSELKLQGFSLQKNIYVAYNLRFHELFTYLKKLLEDDQLISFSAQVGSYLPNWRKESDYRNSYSAKKEWGGGVLRDLSHELDYVLWLCGACIEVTAMGGHLSTLDINSDDIYSILMRCKQCPQVNIQLDYLNKIPMRQIIIQTKNQHSINIDLISGKLILNGEIKFQVDAAIQKTYIKQHELLLKQDFTDFCDYTQGIAVVKLIETIEQACAQKKWMSI